MESTLQRNSASTPCALQTESRGWCKRGLDTVLCWCKRGLDTEAQASEVRLREKTGIGYTDTAQRGWTGATEDVLKRSLGPPERQGAITGGKKEKGVTTVRTYFPVSAPRQEVTMYRSSQGRHKEPSP